MPKQDKMPSIGGREVVRLMVQTYGAAQVLRYLNADIRKYLAIANTGVAENNPLAVSQTLSRLTELNLQMSIALGDTETATELGDSIK